jgi:hypothetical protein
VSGLTIRLVSTVPEYPFDAPVPPLYPASAINGAAAGPPALIETGPATVGAPTVTVAEAVFEVPPAFDNVNWKLPEPLNPAFGVKVAVNPLRVTVPPDGVPTIAAAVGLPLAPVARLTLTGVLNGVVAVSLTATGGAELPTVSVSLSVLLVVLLSGYLPTSFTHASKVWIPAVAVHVLLPVGDEQLSFAVSCTDDPTGIEVV